MYATYAEIHHLLNYLHYSRLFYPDHPHSHTFTSVYSPTIPSYLALLGNRPLFFHFHFHFLSSLYFNTPPYLLFTPFSSSYHLLLPPFPSPPHYLLLTNLVSPSISQSHIPTNFNPLKYPELFIFTSRMLLLIPIHHFTNPPAHKP